MAWSITVNNVSLDSYREVFTQDVIDQFGSHNPEYVHDLNLALEMAVRAGLKSATLSGGRTPTPGSDDEVVVITITGFGKAVDFNDSMRQVIMRGPDENI